MLDPQNEIKNKFRFRPSNVTQLVVKGYPDAVSPRFQISTKK